MEGRPMKVSQLFADTEPAEAGRELEVQARSLSTRAAQLEIATPADAESALVWLRDEIVPRRKAVVDWFAPLKKAAHDAHKTICERETQVLSLIPEALVRQKVQAFEREQRRLREQA